MNGIRSPLRETVSIESNFEGFFHLRGGFWKRSEMTTHNRTVAFFHKFHSTIPSYNSRGISDENDINDIYLHFTHSRSAHKDRKLFSFFCCI